MDLDINGFELILFPGKGVSHEFLPKYNKAYKCWREIWEEAYKFEMNNEEFLHSDGFTRQDEVLSLFYNGECIAVTFYRWINFNESAVIHDSYFKFWPETALQALCAKGKNILLISQFSIGAKFRKNFFGVSLKDLLVGLCYERFIHANCDAGATAVRIQKHMDEAVYKVKGTAISRNMPYSNNQRVDLIGFFPDVIAPSSVPGIKELVAQIFPKAIALAVPLIHKTEEVKNAA